VKGGFAMIAAALWISPLTCCADSANSKTLVLMAPQPKSDGGERQLWLRGVKSAGASGIRVYLMPASEPKTEPEEGSRVGTVFFGHRSDGDDAGQTFVLPLRSSISGQVRLVIVPIPAKKDLAAGRVQLESAEIKAADSGGRN